MFITIRVALKEGTTEDHAQQLAEAITEPLSAAYVEDEDMHDLRYHVDKVYHSVNEGDGNDLGL